MCQPALLHVLKNKKTAYRKKYSGFYSCYLISRKYSAGFGTDFTAGCRGFTGPVPSTTLDKIVLLCTTFSPTLCTRWMQVSNKKYSTEKHVYMEIVMILVHKETLLGIKFS